MAQSRVVRSVLLTMAAAAVFIALAGIVGAQTPAPASYVPPVYTPPPPPPPPSPAALALLARIQGLGDLSMFSNALMASRINLTLIGIIGGGKVTVFAPNNGAFAMLSPELKQCLDTQSGKIDVLTQIMLFHLAVGGNYTVAELKTISRLTAASGMPIDLMTLGDGTIMVEGTARVVVPDAITGVNATVHIINDIIFPESILSTVMIQCYNVPPSASLPVPSAGFF
ncbi:hypothetical protein CBR_g49938 [Chara braunii]|uniref:FAS1 domain-containing protein n=1 Tax=Chara braunii TaxID=69332 RepID=A0A388JPH5_CHABU|nr:hypothetical protein CBR_g49938 [Chara braunii]|eukprot:GBG59673.1 hypothetical protein CBR_g49938 [Chara braunii]